jgi:hypothetical protein
MFDLKKTLIHLLSLLGSIMSYIPAAIYAYVYSHFFTKYSLCHPEKLTDRSDNAAKTEKASRTSSTSAPPLEDLSSPLWTAFRNQPGFLESTTTSIMFQPAKNYSKTTPTLK